MEGDILMGMEHLHGKGTYLQEDLDPVFTFGVSPVSLPSDFTDFTRVLTSRENSQERSNGRDSRLSHYYVLKKIDT